MVKLEEVDDEEFSKEQPGPNDEGDWDTDSESDTSSLAGDADDETILDRITALRDIIPPQKRRQLSSSVSTAGSWTWWGAQSLAKVSWVLGVSVMLLGIPYAVGLTEDQMIAMEEQEREAAAQEGGVLGGGGAGAGQGEVKAAT